MKYSKANTNGPPRVAIYARVSTDLQSPRSVPDQVALCQRWIERQGWVPVPPADVFGDEAVSGGTTHRSSYQRLLSKIAGSDGRLAYNVVVTEDLSRLTREMSETSRLISMAPVWNLRIVGVSDAQDTAMPGSKYAMAYRGISNQQFLDDLHARIRRGLGGRFNSAFHAGGSVFGFRTLPVPDVSGRVDRFGNPVLAGHKLEVRADQATVVKRVFQEAASGMSCREIARGLDRDQVPKPSAGYAFNTEKTAKRGAGYWDPQMIRSILTAERYRGLWRWQKMKCVDKHPVTRKKIMRPSEEVHEQQREDLRLIDDATWNAVQEKLAARAEGVRRGEIEKPVLDKDGRPVLDADGNPKTKVLRGVLLGREKGCTPEFVWGHLMNPLANLLICADCGGPFNVIMSKADKDGRTVRYLGCNRRHHIKACCENAGVFRLPELEAALAETLTGYFSDAKLAAQALRQFQRALQAHRQRLTAEEQQAKADLADAEQEIGKVKQAILAGLIGETTATMLRDAEQKQKAAQERLAAAETARVTEPQPILPREILAGLRAQDHRARREAYHRLLSGIRLRSERGSGKRMVKRWTAEITPRPEAAFKGLPKSLAFGKDLITVGGAPSGRGGPPVDGGG